MKAVINLSCEMEDIPQTVGDFLNLVRNRKWADVERLLALTSEACSRDMCMEALDKIDTLRLLLTQIDNNLMDYSGILSGYVKTKTESHIPTPPEPIEEDETEEQAESD